jgi:hypothetical protein
MVRRSARAETVRKGNRTEQTQSEMPISTFYSEVPAASAIPFGDSGGQKHQTLRHQGAMRSILEEASKVHRIADGRASFDFKPGEISKDQSFWPRVSGPWIGFQKRSRQHEEIHVPHLANWEGY